MTQSIAYLLGRVLIAALFLHSLYPKITDFSSTASYMGSKGIPFPSVLLVGAILFMLLGSLALITGLKARAGAILLILFLIPTTYIFHFDLSNPQETIALLKNLAIMGGLFYVWASGPGSLALKG